MSDPHSEQLLGYLPGALEPPEQELLDRRLQSDSHLRRRLARTRQSLDLLEPTRCSFEPPPDLAARTCEFVASRARTTSAAVAKAPRWKWQPEGSAGPAPVFSAAAETAPTERAGRWSWLDMAVAAAVVLVASALVFPAIHGSRFHARVAACQDNLRELGVGLGRYSQLNKGYFPRVPDRGRLAVAGIYAPTLLSEGFIADDRRVICPASTLAGIYGFRVPRLETLESAPGEQVDTMLPLLGGSYGYSLGHTEDGQYRNTRNLGRRHFALMADVPSTDGPYHQSDNHGGRGQNVLFEDMHVRFLTTPRPLDRADDVFVNDRGLVAAGNHQDDSVIGPSTSTPILSAGER